MNAVDTNILVYAVDATEPVKSTRAIELLSELARREVPLVVPWQVAAEFLACLRRWEAAGRIGRGDVDAYLRRFVLSLPVVYPTVGSLSLALDLSQRFSMSHWDSMLVAACIEAGVNTLYSEDLSANALYASVKVINPFVSES
ncbi:MAG: PIN domain-containing protein [Pirellulales bacterium]